MQTWLRFCGVSAVLLWSVPSFAQTCPSPPSTWRAPLKWFCPNQPALAAEVNGNFAQVVTWLEAKVGPVDAGIVIPPGSVNTAALVNDAVNSAKIAPGTIDSTDLAPGAIGRDRIRDGGVPVYLVTNSMCSSSGLSLSPTCNRSTFVCGTVFCGGSTPVTVYFNCSNACGNTAPCQTSPVTCPEPNQYIGSLVP